MIDTFPFEVTRMRTLITLSLVAILPITAMTQPEAPRPAFDVVEVHVTARDQWVKTRPMQAGYLAIDRYELHRATMSDLIHLAYNVDADQIYGGPGWLDYDRFEVVAKTKPGTSPETLRLMLQTLLAERFHLTVKRDTRDVPGYLLSKGNRELKIKPAADTSISGGCRRQPLASAFGTASSVTVQCRNVTMQDFAGTLHGLAGGPAVADRTGLEGAWDIDLPDPLVPRESAEKIIEALDKLGLKLELGKVAQPGLGVEGVSETPSPNPPDVEKSLPALPAPEFEVASIKPCEGLRQTNPGFETGGRVTAMCMPLKFLIRQAWSLAMNEDPVGAPKWLDSGPNITIIAKAPANVATDPAHNQQARDTINAMLRTLLVDRYQMSVRYEDRPMDAQMLVAVKPKLTKADPAGRTGCGRKSQHSKGQALMVQFACQNITMTQFAEQIRSFNIDSPYPVLDATGLAGAWDFTLSYDAMAGLNTRFPQFAGGAPAANSDAAVPAGTLSFGAALERQLGLKLEMRKRPVRVLVIDHMEEKPREN
jgi:uncharacterized protein (TIGR03435 family)